MSYAEVRSLLLIGVLALVLVTLVLAVTNRYEVVAQHVEAKSDSEAYGGVYRLDRWTGRVTRMSGPGQQYYDLFMNEVLADARRRQKEP